MIKKLFIILLTAIQLYGQDCYFYHFKNKVELYKDRQKIIISSAIITDEHRLINFINDISVYAEKISRVNPGSVKDMRFIIAELKPGSTESCIDLLKSYPHYRYDFGYSNGKDNVIHYPTGEIIVKFKSYVTLNSIDNIARLYRTVNKGKINEFADTYIFTVSPESSDDVFETSSRFSLLDFVEFAQPNFIRTGMLLEVPGNLHNHSVYVPNDSLIYSMWHLNNTGNNIPDGVQGVAGCDMRMFEAWNITTGNPNVIIAITDTGIDTNHADLRPNLTDRSLWYDAFDNDQQPYDEHYHGTGVSGCSSAKGDNLIGTAGVAYNCTVMPVRVFGPAPHAYTTDLILAKGLQWSWTRGASVINCSWGGGVPAPLISHAILNAVRFGRSGRGTVVFGGSGNADEEDVIYPASMPEVIGVGGLSPCNQRKSTTSCDNIGGFQNWGACYGEGLSVVAPTTYIGTTTLLGGWCICGNGTSAASPLAAGIGALIISRNVNLSGDSVKMIIERSARKVGNYSYNILKENGWWNNEMGYGAVDAKAALDMTPPGPSQIYEQTPPVIKIIPPESGIYKSMITVYADIYDISGIASGFNSPRLYYRTLQKNNLQTLIGVKISAERYKFTLPVIPISEGVFYYVAAQDISPVPNITTFPPGGRGTNPPGNIPPPKFLFVRNTEKSDTNFISQNVPVPIMSFKDTFSVMNVTLNKTILDVNCVVNITHTFDADITFSLISPSGTEIVLAGGVGGSGQNFINTVFDDEAEISIDSSVAQAPFTGIFKPIDRLWLLDGENSYGQWKLRIVDNGWGDEGVLHGWSIKFTYSAGSDDVILPSRFALVKNYPNPFNPVTRIVFNVPYQSRIKIIIYDITGRELRTVLDEVRGPMLEDYVDFDANGYSSGVYFCAMFADGKYIDSKKMVLLK